jgi:hypothetical protein
MLSPPGLTSWRVQTHKTRAGCLCLADGEGCLLVAGERELAGRLADAVA